MNSSASRDFPTRRRPRMRMARPGRSPVPTLVKKRPRAASSRPRPMNTPTSRRDQIWAHQKWMAQSWSHRNWSLETQRGGQVGFQGFQILGGAGAGWGHVVRDRDDHLQVALELGFGARGPDHDAGVARQQEAEAVRRWQAAVAAAQVVDAGDLVRAEP